MIAICISRAYHKQKSAESGGIPRLWLLNGDGDLYREVPLVAVAVHKQERFSMGLVKRARQIVRAGYGVMVDFLDHVAFLQTCLRRRTAGVDFRHHGTARVGR